MTFEDWYEAQEGFGFRFERALEDVKPAAPEALDVWLKTAYAVGRADAAMDATDTVEGYRSVASQATAERDAALARAEWEPITEDTRTPDGYFWGAIRVSHKGGPLEWHVHLLAGDETDDIHPDYEQGWAFPDYEFFRRINPPPAPTVKGA